MASGGSSLDGLECSICIEVFTDPRSLPCGHSFCGPPKSCLSTLKQRSGSLKCAVCNESFQLKLEDLKPLYGIRDALASIKSVENFEQKMKILQLPTCRKHTEREASIWCETCNDSICDMCLENSHNSHSMKSFRIVLKEKAKDALPVIENADALLEKTAVCLSFNKKQAEYFKDLVEAYESKMKNLEELKVLLLSLKQRSRDIRNISDGRDESFENYPLLCEVLKRNLSEDLNPLKEPIAPFKFQVEFSNIRDLKTANKTSAAVIVKDVRFSVRAEHTKTKDERWLGLFLNCVSNGKASINNHRLDIEFKLILLNSETDRFISKGAPSIMFSSVFASKGEDKFILWDKLVDKKEGWLVPDTDTISVQCEIIRVSYL